MRISKIAHRKKKASKDKDWLSFGGKKTILQFVNCPPCFKTPRVFQTIPEFFQVVFLDGNKTIRFRDPKKVGGGSSHTWNPFSSVWGWLPSIPFGPNKKYNCKKLILLEKIASWRVQPTKKNTPHILEDLMLVASIHFGTGTWGWVGFTRTHVETSGHAFSEAWVSPQELPSKCLYCRRGEFIDGGWCVFTPWFGKHEPPILSERMLGFLSSASTIVFLVRLWKSSWEWSEAWIFWMIPLKKFPWHNICIYVYTLGAGGSPGTPAPRVFIYIYIWSYYMVDATQVAGWGWVGVRWGGDDNVPCTCTYGRCYATSCSLHLHTWSVLRNIMFLALAHMVGATQVMGWGGVGVGWGGDDNVPCTCTHGRCYATSCSLHLHTLTNARG